jgi:hypothetical protein
MPPHAATTSNPAKMAVIPRQAIPDNSPIRQVN